MKETVDRLLNTDEKQEEDDTDAETDMSTTSSETTYKPRRWTEISTDITTDHLYPDSKHGTKKPLRHHQGDI